MSDKATSAELKAVIKQEYQKCMMDPVYFMKKYCRIQHPIKGKISFNLYPFQEQVLHDFKNHRYNIVLKSRQLGISTLVCGYALWLMMFNSDKSILAIATKVETAQNLISKVRLMYENLPTWLKSTLVEDNKRSIQFKNNSKMKAISSSGSGARSEASALLIIDEGAFIDGLQEIWASSQQTLATGGSCIAISTPNGVGTYFDTLWVSAELGENNFNPIKLKWDVHPERDQSWRDEQTRQLGVTLARQECDADRLTSGNTVVDEDVLKTYKELYQRDPVEQRGMDKEFWVWKAYEPSRNYMVVADVARGDGADYSAFHIFDVETLEQCGEYRYKIGTTEYARKLCATAMEWGNALLVVENSNMGWAVITEILNIGYENLYYTHKREDPYTDPNIHLKKRYDIQNKENMVPGFTTSSATRPLIIAKLVEYFLQQFPKIYSKRLIAELETFVWAKKGHSSNSRAQARDGYNDDLVMAAAIGFFVRDHALRLREYGLDVTRKALSNYTRNTTIFSTISGTRQEKLRDSGWTMPSKSGEEIDLTFLIDRKSNKS